MTNKTFIEEAMKEFDEKLEDAYYGRDDMGYPNRPPYQYVVDVKSFLRTHLTQAFIKGVESVGLEDREFMVFRRPECCVKDFLATGCDGNYYKLQEINPKDFLQAQKKQIIKGLEQ